MIWRFSIHLSSCNGRCFICLPSRVERCLLICSPECDGGHFHSFAYQSHAVMEDVWIPLPATASIMLWLKVFLFRVLLLLKVLPFICLQSCVKRCLLICPPECEGGCFHSFAYQCQAVMEVFPFTACQAVLRGVPIHLLSKVWWVRRCFHSFACQCQAAFGGVPLFLPDVH